MRQPKDQKLNNPPGTQWCSRCNKVRPNIEFGKKRYWCKPCHNKYQTQWAKNHPEKRHKYDRGGMLRRNYGITVEDYGIMFEGQKGLCAICQRPYKSSRNGYMHVDHDHKSGLVRGLLCDKCNRGLGYFNDDPQLFEKAIIYLRKQEKSKLNN